MAFATDSNGGVRIDFVWGTFPMQPSDGRATPLDYTLGIHEIVDKQWSGYPGFVPGASGTWDDITVPTVTGLTEAAATTALTAAGLTKGTVTTADNAGGATALNDGKIKAQSPVAASVVNPSNGRSTAVNLVKYVYTP